MAEVAVNNFTFSYAKSNFMVLNYVNVTFPANHFSLLTGPSGSGKSTLLMFIAGLYPSFTEGKSKGTITFDGKNITETQPQEKNKMVSMMFQNPNQQFAMDTVFNELVFVLENINADPAKMDQTVDNALNFVGISKLKNRKINTLSGGEKQRLALASIVAMDADVIVLDEPFASIDPASRVDLINKLKLLRDEHGKTIILADHDLSDYQNVIDDFFFLDPATHKINLQNQDQQKKFYANFEDAQHITTKVKLPEKTEKEILNIRDFTLDPHGDVLLKLANFSFYKGKTTLVTGHNGIGKSTLFDALTKLLKYEGTITYNGQDIKKIKPLKYAQSVTLLFQDAESQFLNITVKEELDLSMKNRFSAQYSDDEVKKMLAEIDLANRGERIVYSLSEGQKKKLQIIEMLVMAPPVLLMDEPFKGLDYHSLLVVGNLLNEAKTKFGQTQIIISHQLNGLENLVDYHTHFANQTMKYQEVL